MAKTGRARATGGTNETPRVLDARRDTLDFRDLMYEPTLVEVPAFRPLGAYFRVNHLSLVAMHSAMTEAGILYASARVHSGWRSVGKDGIIQPSETNIGGHAFAIVAYDADGLWIQNSWGASWGKQGF